MGGTQLSQLKRIFFDFSSIVLAYCLIFFFLKSFLYTDLLVNIRSKFNIRVQKLQGRSWGGGGGWGYLFLIFTKTLEMCYR